MLKISSLTGQYWSHHLVIQHGAPRLRHLKTRVKYIPTDKRERGIVNSVEQFENDFIYNVYQRYNRARELLYSCEKMYRCIEQIFLSVAESNGDILNMTLRRKLYVLMDWIRLMNTRRREASGVEERARHNERLGWNYDAGSILPAALEELKEYHDIRYGSVESILQFINEMLDKWELLIPSMKEIDKLDSSVQHKTRQDETNSADCCVTEKRTNLNSGLIAYVSTHESLHLILRRRHLFRYRLTAAIQKDSCDSSVSSGSY